MYITMELKEKVCNLGGTGGFWRGRTEEVLCDHAVLLVKLGLPEEEALLEISAIVSAMRAEYGD